MEETEWHMATPKSYSSTNTSFWSTQKIASCALFCALAALATLFIEFPLLPAAPWLKMDPSGIIAVISGFLFGPEMALLVAIVPNFVHLATESGIYGTFMAALANAAIAYPAALMYKKFGSKKGLVAGLITGSICATVLSILFNLIVTPLYLGMPQELVIAMIPSILLPFNLIKVVITSLASALILPAVKSIQRHQ